MSPGDSGTNRGRLHSASGGSRDVPARVSLARPLKRIVLTSGCFYAGQWLRYGPPAAARRQGAASRAGAKRKAARPSPQGRDRGLIGARFTRDRGFGPVRFASTSPFASNRKNKSNKGNKSNRDGKRNNALWQCPLWFACEQLLKGHYKQIVRTEAVRSSVAAEHPSAVTLAKASIVEH